LIEATRTLVREGLSCCRTGDDQVACRKLGDAGAAAIMPLGAPIGRASAFKSTTCASSASSRVRSWSTPAWDRLDAALAIKLGADAVLMDTA
jgi:thiazole synthase